jgi:chromosomal replication initiator protein
MPCYIQYPAGYQPVQFIDGERIRKAVCAYFNVSYRELQKSSRVRRLSYVRQVSFYLLRNYSTDSLNMIGSRYGSRDHTTVIYGANKIRELMKIYPEVEDDLKQIVSIFKQS